MSTFTPSRSSFTPSSFQRTPICTPVSHATAEDQALVESALQADKEEEAAAANPSNLLVQRNEERLQLRQSSETNPESVIESDASRSMRSRRQSRASVGSLVARKSRMSRAKTSMESTSYSGVETKLRGEDTRLRKLTEALDKFLGLVDIRATSENFSAAFSGVPASSLEQARICLVSELKEAIKKEQDVLIREYDLDLKLRELQALAMKADLRAEQQLDLNDERLKDVWRPDLDISTVLHARAVPAQKDRVVKLERELAELERSNARLHNMLTASMSEADDKQAQVSHLLEALNTAVTELQLSPLEAQQLRTCLVELDKELGPRA